MTFELLRWIERLEIKVSSNFGNRRPLGGHIPPKHMHFIKWSGEAFHMGMCMLHKHVQREAEASEHTTQNKTNKRPLYLPCRCMSFHIVALAF